MKHEIPDSDLVLLNGLCSPATQKLVDGAMSRLAIAATNEGLSQEMSEVIQEAVTDALATGKLIARRSRTRYCSCCKKSAGYAKYPRNGRHHRKGDNNHDKPLTIDGMELKSAFITIKDYISNGCCMQCWKTLQPALINALRDVKAEISESITGVPAKYKKHDIMHCKKCGWKGPEFEMGLDDAIFGGTFRSKCPQCPAKNNLFQIQVETVSGEFHLTEVNP